MNSHEIFQGTVKRYQKNIALTSFVKVDGALLDTHKDKLNEILKDVAALSKDTATQQKFTTTQQ